MHLYSCRENIETVTHAVETVRTTVSNGLCNRTFYDDRPARYTQTKECGCKLPTTVTKVTCEQKIRRNNLAQYRI